jgi:hypothetical protein
MGGGTHGVPGNNPGVYVPSLGLEPVAIDENYMKRFSMESLMYRTTDKDPALAHHQGHGDTFGHHGDSGHGHEKPQSVWSKWGKVAAAIVIPHLTFFQAFKALKPIQPAVATAIGAVGLAIQGWGIYQIVKSWMDASGHHGGDHGGGGGGH